MRAVVAPEAVTTATRVIGQTRRGVVFGWVAVVVVPLLPLLLMERGFGVHGPLVDQAFILPVGAACFWVSLRARRWLAPTQSGVELVVSPELLEYRTADSVVSVPHSDIGLVAVIGEGQSGRFVICVYDHRSALLARWMPRWAGRDDGFVVKVLRRAGYPAMTNRDLYDGRFQNQVLGQSPQVAH